ncbi:MAG: hypothetical protein U0K19_03905 [Bifidobacteriaceae bacterium]|nr:hypothetical protein [Bifidobacteriaceae bacterium]
MSSYQNRRAVASSKATSRLSSRRAAKPSILAVPASAENMTALTIIDGGDEYVNHQTLQRFSQAYQRLLPETEVIEVDAGTVSVLDLDSAIGPSLLAEGAVVVMSNLENASDGVVSVLASFLDRKGSGSALDTVVIASRAAGSKGSRILATLKSHGAVIDKIMPLKNTGDRVSFVMSEFRTQGRSVEPIAARELVEAYGARTSDLAAMCDQLCADFAEDPVSVATVRQYTGMTAQATGFQVADAALSGNVSQSVVMLRRAIASGVAPVGIVGALASKLRSVARVSAIASGALSASELEMPNWLASKVRMQARGFSSDRFAVCFEAVARADEQTKGGSGDAIFALEQAVELIARCARQ